jgi:hypothetical protein
MSTSSHERGWPGEYWIAQAKGLGLTPHDDGRVLFDQYYVNIDRIRELYKRIQNIPQLLLRAETRNEREWLQKTKQRLTRENNKLQEPFALLRATMYDQN